MRLFKDGVSSAFNGSQDLMIPKPHHLDTVLLKVFRTKFIFPAQIVFAVLIAI